MKKLGYTKTGIGIGALAGIGIFGCALSAGIIATPQLVPAGLGIIAGSALAGGIIGYLAYPSNSPQPKNNNSSRRIRSDSDPHPDPHYTKNLWKNCFSCFER